MLASASTTSTNCILGVRLKWAASVTLWMAGLMFAEAVVLGDDGDVAESGSGASGVGGVDVGGGAAVAEGVGFQVFIEEGGLGCGGGWAGRRARAVVAGAVFFAAGCWRWSLGCGG